MKLNVSKKINSNPFTQYENNPSQFCYFKSQFFKPQNRKETPKNYNCTHSITLFIMLNKYFILLHVMVHILP